MPPVSVDFQLRPDVMREHDPTPSRMIFWLQGEKHGALRDWRRVCSTPPFAIVEQEGLCCTSAALTPFREKRAGALARVFGMFSGRDPDAIRYILPTGGHAEPAGETRTDVLLVWSGQVDGPLDAGLIAEHWPEHEGCEQLGERLFLVVGAQPPAAPPPAITVPSPNVPPAVSFAGDWDDSTVDNGFNVPFTPAPPPPPPQPAAPPRQAPAGNFSLNMTPYPAAPPTAQPAAPQPAMAPQNARPPQEQLDELSEQIESLCDQGQYAQAVEPASRAAQFCRALHGENHPELATSLLSLAEILCAAGQHGKAEQTVRQAAEVWRRVGGEAHPEFLRSLNLLSALFVLTGRAGDGLQQLLQVALAGDRTVDAICATTSEDLRLLHLESAREDVDRVLSLAAQAFASSPQVAGAALDLVLRRKAISIDAMAARRDRVLSERHPHLKARFEELNTLRGQTAWRILAGPGQEGAAAHQQAVAQWQAQRRKLEEELAAGAPELAAEMAARRPERAAIAAALPPDSALVEYVRYDACDFRSVAGRAETEWGEARYVALVLPAGSPDAARLVSLGEAERIDGLVAAFRDHVREGRSSSPRPRLGGEGSGVRGSSASEPPHPQPLAPASGARGEEEGEEDPGVALRRAVFDPVAGRIGKRTRLVLAPDAALCRLPFEVLPLDDGRRLLDTFLISYLGTGRDVLRLASRPTNPPSVSVVAADVDYEFGHDYPPPEGEETPTWRHSHALEQEGREFARQPDSRIEAARSAALLGVKPWLGETVLESRLKRLRSPRVLHLAVQGFFLPEQDLEAIVGDELEEVGDGDEAGEVDIKEVEMPFMESVLLRAGLALAGANGVGKGYQPPPEAEDGLLTAEEVSGLDLYETELVVLTGTDAGPGDADVGPAVLGLRRAFTLAGARTLVLSLWRVPGLVTAILAERFYANLLKKKLGRAESLREAQTYVRDVTVGELKPRWLTEQVRRQAAKHEPTLKYLQKLAGQPDEAQPFRHPRYWGAFICQGDWNPLP